MAKRLVKLGIALVAIAAAAPPPAAADEARARELYELCAQCHGTAGEGNQAALAPSIAGLDAWYVARQLRNYKQGLRGLHHEDVGGMRMYPMSLTLRDESEIDALAAYVASLPSVKPEKTVEGGDPQRGAQLYAVCSACHGPEGAGNEQMNAPRLSHMSDWYLVSAIQKYKAGARGWNPENANAVLMRGMAAQLPDEQAIRDVVAYIMTFNDAAETTSADLEGDADGT